MRAKDRGRYAAYIHRQNKRNVARVERRRRATIRKAARELFPFGFIRVLDVRSYQSLKPAADDYVAVVRTLDGRVHRVSFNVEYMEYRYQASVTSGPPMLSSEGALVETSVGAVHVFEEIRY